MAITVALDWNDCTRVLTYTKDYGDGSTKPVYGRNLANTPTLKLTSGVANNVQTGADLAYHTVLTVPVGAPVTLDLTAFTDLAERATRAFARLKYAEFWLLGTSASPGYNDATLGGNACTGVTIGAGATNGFSAFLADPTDKVTLGNGDYARFGTRRALGWTVDSTHKNLLLTDLDGAVDAHVLMILLGGSS